MVVISIRCSELTLPPANVQRIWCLWISCLSISSGLWIVRGTGPRTWCCIPGGGHATRSSGTNANSAEARWRALYGCTTFAHEKWLQESVVTHIGRVRISSGSTFQRGLSGPVCLMTLTSISLRTRRRAGRAVSWRSGFRSGAVTTLRGLTTCLVPSRCSLLTGQSFRTTLAREKSLAGASLKKIPPLSGSAGGRARGMCCARSVDVRCGQLPGRGSVIACVGSSRSGERRGGGAGGRGALPRPRCRPHSMGGAGVLTIQAQAGSLHPRSFLTVEEASSSSHMRVVASVVGVGPCGNDLGIGRRSISRVLLPLPALLQGVWGNRRNEKAIAVGRE